MDAGGGIRTREPLRDEVLSLAPLTRLGDPSVNYATLFMKKPPNLLLNDFILLSSYR
jgi:hypothetical protein